VGLGKDLVAVSDAGPLIHLAQIGDLQLLDVFSSVHIPDAVWMETVTAGRVDGTELTAAATIRRHAIDDAALRRFVQEFGPFSLHQGETEALLLCRQLDSPLLLADDLAAREAAWRQGVRPVGSLGIVVRVYHRGRISLAGAENCIQRLYDVSSLFVAKAIADLAMEQLRQSP
jgi:predicted nucleic acid-binding protein